MLRHDKEQLEKRVADHEQQLDRFETMIAHWKGGFVVVVALGTFVGWVLSNLDDLLKVVRGGS